MPKPKIVYYTDEQNDEFSTANITPRRIDESYCYVHSSAFKRFTHFFWYRIVAMPLALLYTRIKFGQRVEGGECLKRAADTGYFLYGNHTQIIGDPLLPQRLDRRRDKYMIVHPDNVSMPILGRLTPSMGALPLPDTLTASKNFMAAISQRLAEKKAIVIYPEAHIWPYYTGIRPFPDTSFHYPVKYGAPVYCFTNTYRKRRFRRTPRIVTVVRGPFFADPNLRAAQARRELRDRVYAAMCADAALSDAAYIEYRKKEPDA